MNDSCRMLAVVECLEFRKSYSSKADFISKLIEPTNAEFRVSDMDVLGEAKTVLLLAMNSKGQE